MALDKQQIQIAFEGGLDNSEEVLVSPRNLTVLENCVFDDAKTIRTREGTQEMSLAPSIASLPAPYSRINPSYPATGPTYRVAQNQNTLLIEGALGLFSKGVFSGLGAVADKNSILRVLTATSTDAPGRDIHLRASVETAFNAEIVASASFVYLNHSTDMGRVDNYDGLGRCATLTAWMDFPSSGPSSFLHVRGFDEEPIAAGGSLPARTQLLDLSLTASGGGIVRVLSSGTSMYVLLNNGVELAVVLAWNVATGVVTYPGFGIAVSSSNYDAIIDPVDGQLVLAYATAATTLFIRKLNASLTGSVITQSFTITNTPLVVCLFNTLLSGVRRYQALYTCDSTNTIIRSVAVTSAGTPTTQVNVLTAVSAVGQITAPDARNGDSVAAFFYDTRVNAPLTSGVFQASVNKTTLAQFSGVASIARRGNLYGRPYWDGSGSGVLLVPVVYLTDLLFPSIFLISANPDITAVGYNGNQNLSCIVVARIHWGAAGYPALTRAGQESIGNQPRLQSTFRDTATGDIVMNAERWGAQAVSVTGEINSTVQIWQTRANITTSALGYAETNRATLLAGASPVQFDGSFFHEEGFSHRPIISSVTRTAAAGNLSAGAYRFFATFVHRDSRGNMTESMPSEAFSLTASAADRYTCDVVPCGLTAKQNVGIRIYRTTAGTTTGVAYLDTNVAGVTGPGTSDADIQANTPLPTTGGILPVWPAPSCRQLVNHQNRLWAAGGETGSSIYFSQNISSDKTPEWSDQLVRHIPATAGRVVQIISIDEKLVVLCEHRIGFIYGSGSVTRAGQQDDYSEFVEVLSGYSIPWKETNSVVRAADGIWFMSSAGLRLLGRNLDIVRNEAGVDVGAEVDNYLTPELAATVTRALVNNATQQARFYLFGGKVLVYDTVYRQWSIFSGPCYGELYAAADATNIGSVFYHITRDTPVLFRTVSVPATDANSDDLPAPHTAQTIVSRITTGWLQFAGVQGFQRVTHLQMIGYMKGPSAVAQDLSIVVYTDFSTDAVAYSLQFEPTTPSGTIKYFESEQQLAQQKCRAMKIEITITPQAISPTLRISSLSLTVGLKKGRAKLAGNQRF